MKTFTITLPDEVAAFVERAVADKKFDDLDHMVQYGLFTVQQELDAEKWEEKEWLREQLRAAQESSLRGDVAPLDIDDILARAAARLEAERGAAHDGSHANGGR